MSLLTSTVRVFHWAWIVMFQMENGDMSQNPWPVYNT